MLGKDRTYRASGFRICFRQAFVPNLSRFEHYICCIFRVPRCTAKYTVVSEVLRDYALEI